MCLAHRKMRPKFKRKITHTLTHRYMHTHTYAHARTHRVWRDGRCCGWYLAGLSGAGGGISCTIGWGDGVSPVGLVCYSKRWLCFRLSSRDLEHKQQQIKKKYCLDHSGMWVRTWQKIGPLKFHNRQDILSFCPDGWRRVLQDGHSSRWRTLIGLLT